MPPKKKAKKSKTQPPAEPLDLIDQVREKAGNRLKSKKKNVNYDIEQNVREIRAILATNGEIFDRCSGSMNELDVEDLEANCYCVSFTRVGFNNVKIYYDEDEDVTRVITCPVHSEQSFDMKALLGPPDGISDIIIVKQMAKFDAFVDYELLFERALLLHEDVLEPVLAKIKDRLMSVQVCLGKIEGWVIEPQTVTNFLEESFGKKLECGEDEMTYCECPEGSHCKDDLCGSCGIGFERHGRYYSYSSCAFMCNGFKVLKECDTADGRHDMAFNVVKESERQRLTKFLEFLAME
ncbi:hypothetical protein ACHAXT_000975 [Thalassiosira profunda]